MHHLTAAYLLKDLAQRDMITVKGTVFHYQPYPQPVHVSDVADAFEALFLVMRAKKSEFYVVQNMGGLPMWTNDRLFELTFDVLFAKQKKWPVTRTDNLEGSRGRDNPLPALFIGSEKTQVRQIPLASERPWPFKHLMELGGMIVCKTDNERDLLMELRQYLNNFPQFEVKVHAERWRTGEVVIVTTYFGNTQITRK